MIFNVMLAKTVREPHKRKRVVCKYVREIDVPTGNLRWCKLDHHGKIRDRIAKHPQCADVIAQGFSIGGFCLIRRKVKQCTSM